MAKTIVAVVGFLVGAVSLGVTVGRSEVTGVKGELDGHVRGATEVHRVQDERIDAQRQTVERVEAASERTASEVERIRRLLEQRGARQAKGER